MKKLLFAAFALVAFSACDTTKTTETTTTVGTETEGQVDGTATDTTTGAMGADTTAGGSTLSLMSLMTQAADGNMAEIAHGRLAAQKATDAEVKKFGQMMTTDHSKAGTEMKRLAAKNNITLPDTMSQVHQDMHKTLSALNGAEFDKRYISHMVSEHEKTVNLFTMGQQSAQDPEVRTFLQKTLPTIQAHLDQARTINTRLNGTTR